MTRLTEYYDVVLGIMMPSQVYSGVNINYSIIVWFLRHSLIRSEFVDSMIRLGYPVHMEC